MKVVGFLLGQCFLLTVMAVISGYGLPNLAETNWQTVLFLTPWGLIQNFLSTSPVMRSFYFETSAGQIPWEDGRWVWMLCLGLALGANAFFFLRKGNRP